MYTVNIKVKEGCTAIKILNSFSSAIRVRPTQGAKSFCHRNNVPYNLFEKLYKVVEMKVSSRPLLQESEKTKETVPNRNEKAVRKVRVLADLCVSNGLQLSQGYLSYADLNRRQRN